MQQLTITLPLPNAKLSPNARVHWAAKAAAVKRARMASYLAAIAIIREQNLRNVPVFTDTVSIQATFYYRVQRRRDGDGLIAQCKAYADGFQDAWIVADDQQFRWQPARIEIDKANPRVEFKIASCR